MAGPGRLCTNLIGIAFQTTSKCDPHFTVQTLLNQCGYNVDMPKNGLAVGTIGWPGHTVIDLCCCYVLLLNVISVYNNVKTEELIRSVIFSCAIRTVIRKILIKTHIFYCYFCYQGATTINLSSFNISSL